MSDGAETTKSLAAIIYERGEDINRIMAEFATDLAGSGLRVGGFVQVAEAGRDGRPEAHVRDLETGVRLPIFQNLGPCAQSCRVDAAALVEVARLLSGALARQPNFLSSIGSGGSNRKARALSMKSPRRQLQAFRFSSVFRRAISKPGGNLPWGSVKNSPVRAKLLMPGGASRLQLAPAQPTHDQQVAPLIAAQIRSASTTSPGVLTLKKGSKCSIPQSA